MENLGALTRLLITAFEDPGFKKFRGAYQAAVNPAKYSKKYKPKYETTQAPGTIDTEAKYQMTMPDTLDLEFLFDRTGVLPDSLSAGRDLGLGVETDLLYFKSIVFDYYGNKHQPRYLRINWGTLDFPCRLTSLDVEYKLFDPNGKPLRAVAKASFVKSVDPTLLMAIMNKQSPDLTHVRTVNEGDTLPLMTADIYGDAKYYLEVAKVNKLSSFRKLKTGQQIVFPPLQKQS